jgi:hypothetical protein
VSRDNILRLAGREFVAVTAMDPDRAAYLHTQLVRAGLQGSLFPGETGQQAARRLLRQCDEAGLTPNLIAAVLDPVGLQWTHEVADTVARILGDTMGQIEGDELKELQDFRVSLKRGLEFQINVALGRNER